MPVSQVPRLFQESRGKILCKCRIVGELNVDVIVYLFQITSQVKMNLGILSS